MLSVTRRFAATWSPWILALTASTAALILLRKSWPLTVELIRRKRKQRLWCVTNPRGKFVLTVINEDGKPVKIRCSFVPGYAINFMVSYRWRQVCTVPENGSLISLNFLRATSRRSGCWVDTLNHLNDPELKQHVMENMGELYLTKSVVAEYFLHKPRTAKEVFQMVAEASRAWMWQEVAVGVGVVAFGSNAARLCYQLLRLGSHNFFEALRTADQWVAAMVYALWFCADAGTQLDLLLQDCDDAEWTKGYMNINGFGFALGFAECLLDVPDESIAKVAELLEQKRETERVVMGAATNLQNNNIGGKETFVKTDLCAASLAVVSAMPEFAGAPEHRAPDERIAMVLSAMRAGLRRAAIVSPDSTGVFFHPVPCGDRRVTDLFQFDIRSVRFVGEVSDWQAGRQSHDGEGHVQVCKGGKWLDSTQYHVWVYCAALGRGAGRPVAWEAMDVVSTWVQLEWCVDVMDVDVAAHSLLTACGLRLLIWGDVPRKRFRQSEGQRRRGEDRKRLAAMPSVVTWCNVAGGRGGLGGRDAGVAWGELDEMFVEEERRREAAAAEEGRGGADRVGWW